VPIDPPPRRGRRDNGLDAAAYVPLADVDPRVGEHLLDLLKLAGVPAYLEPSADVEPYTRTLALPSPPTDRLWVDRAQRATAREILEAESAEALSFPLRPGSQSGVDRDDDRPSQGLADLDEERAWEEIVAAFDSDAAQSPVPRWPVPEDAEPDPPAGQLEPGTEGPHPADQLPGDGPGKRGSADGGRADDRGTPGRRTWPEAGAPPPGGTPNRRPPRGDRTPSDGGPADDEEEHYHPPPPPPMPRPSRRTVLGIVLVGLGALLLFGPALVGIDPGTGFTFGVLAILAGAVVLVLGLRDSRSDDGPDDGAVV
jgi:hypothetical protein